MKKTTFILLLFTVALGAVIFMACPRPPAPPRTPDRGMIKGYVFAEVRGNNQEKPRKILLPDVLVTVNDSLGNIVDTVRTDLDGYYVTKVLRRGNYRLCLNKDGFSTTCHQASVVWFSNHPGPLKIDLNSPNYLFGTALLKDGRPGIYRNAVFAVDFFTTVEANLGGVTRSTRANVSGEYLLTEVTLAVPWQVKAKCQNAVVSQTFNNNGGPLDLTLPNSSPAIRGIAASNASGQAVMRTSPGQTLTVRAVVADPENHLLTYVWVPMADAPGSTIGSTNQITWQLGSLPGNYRIFMLVMDGFGGTAYQPFDINAGDERVKFSGIVREIDGSGPIAGAEIRVNGQLAGTSDASGYFKFSFPQAGQNRYVLNIEKVGYMLHSSILFNDATGKEYLLVKSSLAEFNPTAEIVFVETEDEFTRFGDDTVQPPFKRPPARVVIPANAILDSAGNKVTTPVLVGLRNVDLYNPRGLMPGDYGAVKGGVQKRLDSYGAVDIQIRDKTNPSRRYKLDPGVLAEVSIPIASPLATSAPASTTFWDYNEASGLWEDIGTLTRVGDLFVGKTNRFSTLNADVAFTNATCIQLLDNPNSPAVFPVAITVSVPTSGAPKVLNYTLYPADMTPGFIIVRLPPLLTLPAGVTIDVTDASSRNRQHIVPTSSPVPGAALLAPDPPWDYCSDVYLFLDQLPLNPGSVFLSRVETQLETETEAYYRLIGATNSLNVPFFTRDTWKTSVGFTVNTNDDDFNASYFNAGDLAFWRGMHQKNSGGKVSFYVSNFTRDDDSDADVDLDGLNSPNNNTIATVAMEFSPISGPNSVTKFLVFDGPGNLIEKADLDGYGPKYIPGLCIECHGGNEQIWTGFSDGIALQTFYDDINTSFAMPKFLPFDLQSFVYSKNPGFDRPTQEPDFLGLNNRVLETNSGSSNIPEIRAFLEAAYANTLPMTVPFNDNRFPPDPNVTLGWGSPTPVGGILPQNFYTQVIGPSCRGCHLTRSDQNLRFGTQDAFDQINNVYSIGDYVFTYKTMPNAKVPFVNFWTSNGPRRPEELCKFLGGTVPPLLSDPNWPCQ
ncbi:MAG: carboxypeptidase regulatory-like domain-containing protein [Saprospiraceae bacterium]